MGLLYSTVEDEWYNLYPEDCTYTDRDSIVEEEIDTQFLTSIGAWPPEEIYEEKEE